MKVPKISRTMQTRLEVFFLTFAGALLSSPATRSYLKAHQALAELVGCGYVAWRAASVPNPTLPVNPAPKE